MTHGTDATRAPRTPTPTAPGASPFHEGERRVQERLGVREVEAWAGRVVRPFLPEPHRAFFEGLPFVVLAARDAAGRPWATIVAPREARRDGLVTSPDPRSLVIDAPPPRGDALEGALAPGADVALLGIDLAARRRNRVHGRVGRLDEAGGRWSLEVQQSFGNCPRFIRPRAARRVAERPAGEPVRARALSASQRAWLGAADTFFIASGYRGEAERPSFGMDASHRGGDPGFVRVESDTRLTFPDYKGNDLFNTLGNLELDPRAALLFVDFVRGGLLELTGRATVEWEPRDRGRFPGAERLVHFELEALVELPGALPLRWDDA